MQNNMEESWFDKDRQGSPAAFRNFESRLRQEKRVDQQFIFPFSLFPSCWRKKRRRMRESGGGLKIKKKTSLFFLLLLLLLHIMSWAHGGPYLRETQKGPKSGISYNYLLALLSHVTTTHLKHQRGGVGPKRYRRARPYIPLFRFVRGKKEKWYSLYQLDNIEAYKLQHVENFCVDITKVFLIYIYFSSSSFLWLERRDRGRHLTRYGIPPSAQPSLSPYT